MNKSWLKFVVLFPEVLPRFPFVFQFAHLSKNPFRAIPIAITPIHRSINPNLPIQTTQTPLSPLLNLQRIPLPLFQPSTIQTPLNRSLLFRSSRTRSRRNHIHPNLPQTPPQPPSPSSTPSTIRYIFIRSNHRTQIRRRRNRIFFIPIHHLTNVHPLFPSPELHTNHFKPHTRELFIGSIGRGRRSGWTVERCRVED